MTLTKVQADLQQATAATNNTSWTTVTRPASAFRISEEAVRALHEVTEHFMIMMFEGANMIASNAHRTLVYERDIQVMDQLTKQKH
jgi:histone H3/H4